MTLLSYQTFQTLAGTEKKSKNTLSKKPAGFSVDGRNPKQPGMYQTGAGELVHRISGQPIKPVLVNR